MLEKLALYNLGLKSGVKCYDCEDSLPSARCLGMHLGHEVLSLGDVSATQRPQYYQNHAFTSLHHLQSCLYE